MLQDNIKKIEKYFKSIEINDGVLIVKVSFKDKWGVYPSKDEKIKVVNSKTSKNEWMYYGNYNEVSVDDMFDLINETINVNLTAAAKLELLDSKFNELKQLFASESLERLKTLTFAFSDTEEVKPKKRKYTRHKKITTESIQKEIEDNLKKGLSEPIKKEEVSILPTIINKDKDSCNIVSTEKSEITEVY